MNGRGWLTFAASPSFALMAIICARQGAGPGTMLCGELDRASPLGGMTVMYVLMSVFHAAPWLNFFGSRFRG